MSPSQYAHVTMLLCELQGLPTGVWEWFIVLVIAFKALHAIGMDYLWDCLLPRTSACPTFQVPSFIVDDLLFLFCCFIPAPPRVTLLEMSGFIKLTTSYKSSKHFKNISYIFLVHLGLGLGWPWGHQHKNIMGRLHLLSCIRYSLYSMGCLSCRP